MKKFLVVGLVVAAMLILAVPAFGNGVVHRVSVGSPDICYPDRPGCDANLSILAIQYADGSVKGELTDAWGNGGYYNAKIDCLVVDGNEAWLSGVITVGKSRSGFDLRGYEIFTRVKDMGSSANDPPDQLAFVGFYGLNEIDCTAPPYPLELFDAPQGQVIVK
jgi:hypothetical protein